LLSMPLFFGSDASRVATLLDRAKKLKEQFFEFGTRVWDVYHAQTFADGLKEFRKEFDCQIESLTGNGAETDCFDFFSEESKEYNYKDAKPKLTDRQNRIPQLFSLTLGL